MGHPLVYAGCDTGIYRALLSLMVWLPIPLGSNRPWAWALMEVAIMLMAVAWLWRGYTPQALQPLKRAWPLWVSLLLVQVWVACQWQWVSQDPNQTLVALLKGFSYLTLFALTLVVVNTPQRLKGLAIALVFSGTLQACYAGFLNLSGMETSLVFGQGIGDRANGSFVYPNHLANYLMLCLSIGIGLLIANLSPDGAGGRWRNQLKSLAKTMLGGKAQVRVALAIMVVALVLTRSRMGNTAFFASMLVMGVLALMLYRHRPKSLTILLVSLLAIDTFIVGAWFGVDKVKERLESTSLSAETRDEVVRDGLVLLQEVPVTGTGAGSFYAVFPRFQGPEIRLFYDHAHNDYLQFAIEFGLPATLLLGAMVLYALFVSLRALAKRRNRLMRGMGFGSGMAIIGMLIHLSVDFPLQAPANAATFVVILAMGWLAREMPSRGGKRKE